MFALIYYDLMDFRLIRSDYLRIVSTLQIFAFVSALVVYLKGVITQVVRKRIEKEKERKRKSEREAERRKERKRERKREEKKERKKRESTRSKTMHSLLFLGRPIWKHYC